MSDGDGINRIDDFDWLNIPADSGTPGAMLAVLSRSGSLVILDQLPEGNVLVEFPFGCAWQEKTGCRRFVRLRRPSDGAGYALVR